jgi:uncharacterized damage-inducible protein DinB
MNCREGNQQIIQQMTDLLKTLDNQIYAQPLEVFRGSSIGQHFRHILDFYLCLLRGIADGTVDYARRERNLQAETDVEFVKQAFYQVAEQIEQVSEQQRLQVRGDFSIQTEQRPELLSSVGRELMFAYDHAVHHLAMIKIGIAAAAPAVLLDQNLGVAPSTLKHRNGVNK